VQSILQSLRSKLNAVNGLSFDIINDCNAALRTVETSLSMSEFLKLSKYRCIKLAKGQTNDMNLMPHYETINLYQSLDLPRSVLASLFPEHKVRLKKIAKEVCSHLITDRQWLQENLLCFGSNAAKYSPPGSRIEFTLSLCRESELRDFASSCEPILASNTDLDTKTLLLVECEDNGIGMSEEAMASLFAPFQQAQRLAGGTGLGLFSLSQRMEALSGYCGVRGRRDGGEGSLFWFAVPYRPDSNAALFLFEDNDAETVVTSTGTNTVTPLTATLKINTTVQSSFLPLGANVRTSTPTVSSSAAAPAVSTATATVTAGKHILPTLAIRRRSGALSPGSLRLKLQLIEEQQLLMQQQQQQQQSGSSLLSSTDSAASLGIASRAGAGAGAGLLPALSLLTTRLGASTLSTQNQTLFSTSLPKILASEPMLSSSVSASSLLPASRTFRVLLVEDTVCIRKVTTQLLRKGGFDVVTATNGVEALDVLSKEVFDVVLMDLHMPVMDGIEAVKRLRAREAAAALHRLTDTVPKVPTLDKAFNLDSSLNDDSDEKQKKEQEIYSGRSCADNSSSGTSSSDRQVVIALTANNTAGMEAEVKKVGFDYYLEKPISITKLQAALFSLCGSFH
jgi:CheY-like chemotaxis protein